VIRRLAMLMPVLLVVLLFVSACTPEEVEEFLIALFGNPVVVDPPDDSAPVVSLIFFDPATGQKVTLKTGDPPTERTIQKSDHFFVLAVAEDPQGVRNVTVFPTGSIDCKPKGDIGCLLHLSFQPYSFTSSAGVGDTATTKLWLVREIDGGVSSDACPSHCTLKSVRIGLYARGENFSGLASASPQLTFVVNY